MHCGITHPPIGEERERNPPQPHAQREEAKSRTWPCPVPSLNAPSPQGSAALCLLAALDGRGT